MSATTSRNSASVLAYMYYWRRRPPADFCKVWMVLCFPLEAVYIRRLTRKERAEVVYEGDVQEVWYGVFDQFTFLLLATSDSLDCLVASAQAQGHLPMFAH